MTPLPGAEPVATAFTVRRATLASRIFGVVALVAVVVLVLLPTFAGASTEFKMVELLALIAMAQMWNLMAGFAGVVSVGQQAFVGLGAYGMIVFVNNEGFNLYLSVVIAAVAATIVAIPMGLIAFQLRGSYFAIGTWVLAEAARLVMINNTSVGGGNGASIQVTGYDLETRQDVTYWLALVAGVGAVLTAYLVLRSRLGLRMQAIRDNEDGARGLGTSVYRTRFAIWMIAAFWTAFAGAVFYLGQIRVQPNGSFSVVQWIAPIIFIVVIGGIGTIEGPVIGAVLYYLFREQFKNQVNWYTITLGVIAIVVALVLQKGIWGVIRARTGLDLFPVRRRLVIGDPAPAGEPVR
ncbi:MAG: branched-chain amino acid ABC transporter permease [Ilumatobacteraceae bacterium]